ncbi:MAG: alpha/beta fold hydrolase [Pseudomonadota bacterium]
MSERRDLASASSTRIADPAISYRSTNEWRPERVAQLIDKLSPVTDSPDIIEKIYEATLDPAALERTMEHWVASIERELAASSDGESLDAATERHLQLGFQLLEQYDQNLAALTDGTAVHMRKDGTLIDVSPAADALYSVGIGDSVRDLPIDEASLDSVCRWLQEQTTTPTTAHRVVFARRQDREVSVLLWLSSLTSTVFRLSSSEVLWQPEVGALLEASFDLSPSEIEIVQLLIEGYGIEQVAEVRSRSLHTVRTQLREVYSKTGISSFPELLRLIVGLTAAQELDRAPGQRAIHNPPNSYPRKSQRRLLTLPDGRILDYSEFGAQGGIPVLFLHDEICGDAWTASGVDAAIERNLRIIAPLRPNYGRTDPPLAGSNRPTEQLVQDVFYLLDKLGIGRVVLLSRVIGSTLGSCLVEDAPERVLAFVAVAPALPTGPEHYRDMDPLTRTMVRAVTNTPALARFLVRTRYAYFNRYGYDRYLATHYPDTRDQRLLGKADVRDAIALGAAATGAKRYQGFLGDIEGRKPDSAAVAKILRMPTRFVIGEFDRKGRRARAESVIAAGANAQLIVLPDASELLFFSHTDAILDVLVDLVREAS